MHGTQLLLHNSRTQIGVALSSAEAELINGNFSGVKSILARARWGSEETVASRTGKFWED